MHHEGRPIDPSRAPELPETRDFTIGPEHVALYVRGVRRLVAELRRQFPHARVAWRTIHPASPAPYGSTGTTPRT